MKLASIRSPDRAALLRMELATVHVPQPYRRGNEAAIVITVRQAVFLP